MAKKCIIYKNGSVLRSKNKRVCYTKQGKDYQIEILDLEKEPHKMVSYFTEKKLNIQPRVAAVILDRETIEDLHFIFTQILNEK